MGKRQERRAKDERGKRSKKAKREPKPTVYRKPYHVNLGQSLAQLRGWGPPTHEPGGLRGRWGDAVHGPIGQLSVEQLELLLTQGADADDLHYLWPVIFDRLRANICAAHGSGLLALMVGRRGFWAQHPHAAMQLVELIEAKHEQLELAPRGLAALARGFVEHSSTLGEATSRSALAKKRQRSSP